MKRFFRRALFFTSLVGVLYSTPQSAATPYDDLLTFSPNDPSPTRRLSKEEAMEDVKTLARILKEGYAGWEVLDLDWNRAFVEVAKEIEGKPFLNARDLVDLCVDHLTGIEDRHLGFSLGKGRGREWFPVSPARSVLFSDFVVEEASDGSFIAVETPKGHDRLVNATLVSAAQKTPKRSLFRTLPSESGNERYLIGAASKTDDAAMLEIEFQAREGESVHLEAPLHPSRARLNHAHPRPYRLTRIPFPRIELGSFSTLHSVDLEDFVHSAEALREEQVIVVDLRGNAGGSDRFGQEWLEGLTGERPQSWKIRELVSPVTLQGDVLLHEWLLANNGTSSAKEEAGGRLEYFRERLAEGEKEGLEKTWTEVSTSLPNSHWIPQPNSFQGRLVILTDQGTQSSAETFLLMARQLPGTVVVGENSGGMMRFGEVKLYRLRNSGVWVQAGSKHFEDPTGAFREGWGFAPDYWIDDSSLISSIPGLVERLSGVAGAGADPALISSSGAGAE